MPKRTKSHDTWLYEKLTDARIAENYINAALEDSPEMFLVAMRNVAEAHRMAKVAQEAGVNRESLYRAFSKQGNPTLNTLTSVLDALGLVFSVRSKVTEPSGAGPSGQAGIVVESTAGAVVCVADFPRKTAWTSTSPTYTGTINSANLSSKIEVPLYLLTAETADSVFPI